MSVLDAYIYFIYGDYYSMDYNLMIGAFPVLVLMTGRAALSFVRNEYRIMNENMTLRLEGELLYKNYNQTEKYIEETKLIWHDIDKHFLVVNRLLENGDYTELKYYLEHTGYVMKKTKNAYLCENRLINAILTDKLSEAEGKDIKVSFTGNLPEKLNIQGNDLCSLLVNMLENAIEACDKIPRGIEKKLDITLGMKNDFIYFGISNTAYGTPCKVNDRFVTSKEDHEKHGYGISIMQRIARKYDGAFDAFSSENSFMVKVALKNTPQASEY
jgi:sensor histidine kinase regulating citrate/malate metabolism